MTPEKLDELERVASSGRMDLYVNVTPEDLRKLIAAARRETALREALERLASFGTNDDEECLYCRHDPDMEDEHDPRCPMRPVRALLSEVPRPTPKRKQFSYHPPYDDGDVEVPQ